MDYDKLFFVTQSGKATELEAVQYTPRYIQPAWDHPEATRWVNRMTELEETLPPGDYVWAKELYERMLDRSQRMHKKEDKYLRGYVLDARLEPAAAARIAAMARLGLTAVRVTALLKQLERAGLIERVALPEAPGAVPAPDGPDGVPEGVDAPDAAAAAAKKRAIAAQKYGKRGGKTQTAAMGTGDKCGENKDLESVASQSRVSRESVATGSDKKKNKKEEEEGRKKNLGLRPRQTLNEECRPSAVTGDDAALTRDGAIGTADSRRGPLTTPTPTGTAEAGKPPDDGLEATGTMMPTAEPDADGDDGRGTDGDLGRGAAMGTMAAAAPTTTPPKEPTQEPTETESRPTGSGPPGEGTIRIADQIDRLYDRTGYGFAEAVYRAILTPHGAETPGGRREIEAFAAAWQRAQRAAVTPTVLDELWRKGVRTAERLGGKRQRGVRFSKSPEAVWMFEFNQRLAAVQRAALKECKVL